MASVSLWFLCIAAVFGRSESGTPRSSVWFEPNRGQLLGRTQFVGRTQGAFLYMTGAFPLEQVDHQNGIRDDNRWINLRAVSFEENRRNHKTQRNNTSGVPGVSWDNKISSWVARIGAGGKRVVLGTFDDFDKAIEVRLSAELEYEYHPNHGRRVDGGKNGASY